MMKANARVTIYLGWHRVMDEVEIDVVQLQALERLVERLLHQLRPHVRGWQLQGFL